MSLGDPSQQSVLLLIPHFPTVHLDYKTPKDITNQLSVLAVIFLKDENDYSDLRNKLGCQC